MVEKMISNKGRHFEAGMDNGFFCATHFLCFGGRKIYDTGIDSQDIIWKPQEFVDFYRFAYWKIDQIV